MDGADVRRNTLQRVVREPDWQPEIAGPEGEALRDMEILGWVVLEIAGRTYRHHLTERGLERHRLWGDERRSRSRDTFAPREAS